MTEVYKQIAVVVLIPFRSGLLFYTATVSIRAGVSVLIPFRSGLLFYPFPISSTAGTNWVLIPFRSGLLFYQTHEASPCKLFTS